MRDPLSKTIKTIQPSGIRKFFDIVSEMDDAISLGVGEPDFDTPWHIRDEGIYSLEKGRTFYTSNAGLKELREEKAWTQTELAKILGVTRSCVNAWEMGISVPSTQYVVELASLFHISTDFLLGVEATASVSVEGLSDEDIQLVHTIIDHLRSHR